MKSHSPNSSASPFPGQRPYAEPEARVFFGRDAETDLVVQGLLKSRVTLLSGPASVGKTSLLRAGVMPRLRDMALQPGQTESPIAPVVIFWDDWQRAQADPLTGLIDEIQRCCVETLPGLAAVRVPRVRALEHVIEYWAAKTPLFIIFDRFEDYLLSHGDEDGEGKFSVEFPRVVKRSDLGVNFLIAMRGGAHAKLGRLAQRLPQLFDRSLRLKPLSVDAARAAIVLPIQAWNREHPELVPVHVDSALVDYVIRSVSSAGTGAATGATSDGAVQVDASSLQRTMQELWESQIGRGTHVAQTQGEARVLHAPAVAEVAAVAEPAAGFGAMPDVKPAPPAISTTEEIAEAPVTAPRRWRSARSGRTFAALAFLFICAYAVFGAAGWIAEVRDKNDKQQARNVQEKADQALARARETLAKAAQWQAANQQPSQEKAAGIKGVFGDEGTVTPPAPNAVGAVDRSGESQTQKPADKATEKRLTNGDAAQPEQPPAAAKADNEKSNQKPIGVERPRPSMAQAPAPTLSPDLPVSSPPKSAAAAAAIPPAPATQATATAPATQGTATAPVATRPAVPSTATSEAAPQVNENTVAIPGGSPADEIPAWVKEPAVEAPPQASPVEAAPAPVRAAPSEKHRTTVDVRQEKNAAKKILQARAKDNPPRPGARVQSFPSNNVIDAVRAQSPSSGVLYRDSGKSSAQSDSKASPATSSNAGNAGPNTRGDAPPSIFIHVRDQSQLAQTMRLKRRLEANGIVVSGIKTVTRGPDDADLRYFRRDERGEARQMVNLLQRFNVPVDAPKYISGFESTATLRQYELWFPAVN